MISFNTLGCNGYLGNQMFQYSALRGISSHKGYEHSIPDIDVLINRPFGSDIIRCFNVTPTKSNQNYSWIKERTFEFDKYFFDECPDNVDIVGYFQSEKYFKHIEDDIRKEFSFHSEILKTSIEYKKNKFANSEIISLHIRRGDYTTDPNFDCLPLDYYYEGLKLLPEIPVLVITNDQEWCRKKFDSKKFIVSPFKDACIDLCLMSLSNYHIIANSSFSWWGSWLANSKKTIAPKNWFSSNGNLSHNNTKDLYLPNWIVL